jgi:lipoprotein-anchoring transpeptidase ErfK/SrfK
VGQCEAMGSRFLSKIILLVFLLAGAAAPSAARPPQSSSLGEYSVGSIIIKTTERKLLFVSGVNDIITYKIAVGRQGREWTGSTSISRKVLNPAWAPPPNIRKDNPRLPALVSAGPGNPLGAAVLVLGDGTYGIHGTNRPETIGTFASYGCFRMYNKDILDLFSRVAIGTSVTVVP